MKKDNPAILNEQDISAQQSEKYQHDEEDQNIKDRGFLSDTCLQPVDIGQEMLDQHFDDIFCVAPGAFGAKLDTHQGIYGLHPMFKSSAELKQPAPASLTSFQDRVTNMESMVVAFTSENSLSFSLVPKMLELAKTLSDDKKALDSITMNRTTASYKTRFGVGKTFEEDLIRCLKTSCFSLNMDESTSSNYQKVLTILASYFCKISNKVVVRHLSSLTCVTVNSEALYTKVVDVFETRA
ncbi:unnamed protein product [Mytilus edulis]|uniref:Uncharacterized protein n=1 Tax=Mytilus edulis TaxID=6550 RepID=A0A8S3R925_MYTED|nr:unnamed protein product [Mytilus edulis]